MEPAAPVGGPPAALAVQPIQLTKAVPIPGYLPGVSQPCLLVDLVLASKVNRLLLEALDGILSETLPAAGALVGSLDPSVAAHGLLARLVGATLAVLDRSGMPVLAPAKVVGGGADPGGTVRLALPTCCAERATFDALAWCAGLVNLALAGQPVLATVEALPGLVKKIGSRAPQGTNPRLFLKAAHAAGIPVTHVWRNVFQFGWGSRARRLDSSFTDETSVVGANLAKNKRAAAQVMRAAGLPVPRHEVAHDADHAARLAGELGYPVVVKPVDLDGGLGVAAGLPGEQAVRKAFALARALSAEVLVEQHVEGKDYRVHVHKGEVFWVTYRVPGGVTGDGASPVAQLLETLNADPQRGERGSTSLLKRIHLDDEAHDLLAEQGLTAQSVPKAGQFVRLRRAANIGTGGQPIPALHLAHPDNLALAARAARVVGLDLAGVDLLIPDIGRSWLETGAAICEINAQPQYNAANYAVALERLVPHRGRIPVVVVLGDEEGGLCRRIAGRLAHWGCAGIATAREVRVGSQVVSKGPLSAYDGGRALLVDPAVDIAVIGISETALAKGMPVDSFDVLVLAGPMTGSQGASGWERWRRFAAAIASMTRRSVIVNQDCAEWAAQEALRGAPGPTVSCACDEVPQAVWRALSDSAA